MSYQITVSENGKYFRIRSSGDVTVEHAYRWSEDLKEMSQAHGIRRYLFDVRNSRNVSDVLENYKFAYRDADRLGLDKTVRSAILVSYGDQSHDFIAATMHNAGFYVRLFTDERAAMLWLDDF